MRPVPSVTCECVAGATWKSGAFAPRQNAIEMGFSSSVGAARYRYCGAVPFTTSAIGKSSPEASFIPAENIQ